MVIIYQKLIVIEMLQSCFQAVLHFRFFQLLQKIAAFDEIGDVMVLCRGDSDSRQQLLFLPKNQGFPGFAFVKRC